MKTLEDRFWDKVDRKGPEDCWEWTGGKSKGYGRINCGGTVRNAHRVSWEIHHGPVPDGEGYHGTCVCHSCDNPACVNPAHLWLGSNVDNMRDRDQKGRTNNPIGTRNHSSILTEAKVRAIRNLHGYGWSPRKLSESYEVSLGCIENVIYRRNWRHVA